MFDPTSRYAGIEIATRADPDGHPVAYVRRRFAPQGRSLPLLVEIVVAQDDRVDLITSRTLGDPEHFWRVCDANDAMNPFDLTSDDAVGRPLRVPVPQL
jgi:hypothetical protein